MTQIGKSVAAAIGGTVITTDLKVAFVQITFSPYHFTVLR